ncbi:MAG: 30S ribosomal protein S18 [Parcubacteria group bacterium RIFCSPHIGHO2_01_FULL_47_10b]|nr:MAG: 30S ribosomal protein S18 [Parcubacteria group bacterium RIFCSPHIGHO2_01_FULL_47_10b]
MTKRTKQCFINESNIHLVDYKNVRLLKAFVTPQAKIAPRRRTGASAKVQREVAHAIKRARFMGFLPYTTKVIDTR